MKANKENSGSKLQDRTDNLSMNTQNKNTALKFGREDIIQGLIYSEILGKPRAKRKRRWQP